MEYLIFEKVETVGILKISRPTALNALNRQLVDELDELLDEIVKNNEISVLVLTADNNFAAGADIKSMMELHGEEAKAFSFSGTFDKLADLEIPTIAAIEGFALGGGLELALACDFRIASKTAKLGFPEINLGIMPGAGGTIRAPRLIGASRAKELILLGERIEAEQAERMGLVNKVVEPEALLETAMGWAKKLSRKAPISMGIAKKTIQAGLNQPQIKLAMKIEAENWAELFETEDQKEGMKAFAEKRMPIYQGK